MARVVQGRSSAPPYLLIVSVFLFLIATAFAVVFYTQFNDAGQKRDIALSASRNAAAKEVERAGEVCELAKFITGDEYQNADIAFKDAVTEKADDKIYLDVKSSDRPGLAALVRRQFKALGDQGSTLAQSQADSARLIDERKAQSNAMDKLRKDFETAQAAFGAKSKQFDESLLAEQKKYEDRLTEARQAWERDITRLEQDKTNQAQEIAKRDQELQERESAIVRLKQLLQSGKPKPSFDVVKPDGKVLRVLDEGTCYIDLSSRDGVQPGMTFRVFSRSASSTDPNAPGKGSIEVRNATPNFSECHIVSQNNLDPIVAGDPVANIAFGKGASYVFVVEGLFDLRGTGKASEDGAKEIKDIVRRCGGKIKTDLDYDVDFLVLGEEPQRPQSPADNPQGAAVYEAQMKAIEHYQKIKSQASGMPVHVLNVNRFLTLTGSMPVVAN